MIDTINLRVPARSSLVASSLPLFHCVFGYDQNLIIFTAFYWITTLCPIKNLCLHYFIGLRRCAQSKIYVYIILLDYDAVPNQLSNHRTI
jgi:hypothetical protein